VLIPVAHPAVDPTGRVHTSLVSSWVYGSSRLSSAVAEAVATLTEGVTDSRQSGEDGHRWPNLLEMCFETVALAVAAAWAVHVQLQVWEVSGLGMPACCTCCVCGRLSSAVAEAVATLTEGVTDSRQSGEDGS
jgi:hypothetical protein